MKPNAYFMTLGVGVHEDKLISFEFALRKAGIAEYNLAGVKELKNK